MFNVWRLLVAIVAGAALAVASAGAQVDRELGRLGESLSGMGMSELLEALIEQHPQHEDTPTGLALRAELLLAKAAQYDGAGEPEDMQRRRELLSEAGELFTEAAAATADATDDEDAVIEHYRFRVRKVEVLGIHRPQSHVARLMFLRGGPDDRQQVLEDTEEPVELVFETLMDLERQIQRWRQDLMKLATVMPDLEAMERAAMFRDAWICFYRGMAKPVEQERQRETLLTDAIDSARNVIDNARVEGTRRQAMLIAGMASRELGRHDQAMQYLSAADDQSAAPGVRVQAKFNKTLSTVESASGAETGLTAIDNFVDEATDMMGAGAAVQMDVHAAILRDHLFRRLSSAAREAGDQEQADEYLTRSQEALLDFLDSYANLGVQQAFLEIIGQKYAEVEDAPGEVLMLARADQADEDEAADLLADLLEDEGGVAVRLRPLVLWRLGLMKAEAGQNREAADHFLELVENHEDHQLAPMAGRNAASSYSRVISGIRRAGGDVSLGMREEFIDVLRTITERWPDEPGIAEWNLDLGWQLQLIAEATDEPLEKMREAIAAYKRVPEDSEDALEAEFLTMALETELLLNEDIPETERRSEARDLAGKLSDYADKVAGILESEQPADAEDLRGWGAEADFLAIRLEFDVLDRGEEALARVRDMSERWPGDETLRRAAEFEIRQLVEMDRTDDAIDRVDQFREEYPEQAKEVVHLVAWQVRERLRELEAQAGTAQQRDQLAEVFVQFASDLYQRADDLSQEERYPFKQMYAEALVESGDAERALEFFERCREFDEQRRQQDPELSVDAANIRGLARAHQELGNYSESARLYSDLVDGLDPEDRLYWRTELEYARVLLELRGDNPAAMARLATRIRQLRSEDRLMGGLHADFDEVQSRAGRLARQ